MITSMAARRVTQYTKRCSGGYFIARWWWSVQHKSI